MLPGPLEFAEGSVLMVQLSEVRRGVFNELLAAGFEIDGGLLQLPQGEDPKAVARMLHSTQRTQVLKKAEAFINRWEDRLLDRFADGRDIDPARIDISVSVVESEADAALFRYASLHWAVPVSQGYGRRTRFLITDRSNGKLIGIFALGDPVFNLGVRDRLIGWDQEQRQERLYNVFDAYVLGAVEPYRQLIAGKMAALCTVSDEVSDVLAAKYAGTVTHIQGREKISRPVLVTTTSALGRSSIYNRLKYRDRLVFMPVGYTQGFGHFQFSDALFEDLVAVAEDSQGFRGSKYGDGPNWKIRTIRLALTKLGLSGDLLKHGIQREVYLAPLGVGWRSFLRGERDDVQPFGYPLQDLSDFYVKRWVVGRAERRPEFREWSREGMRLSKQLPTPRRQPALW